MEKRLLCVVGILLFTLCGCEQKSSEVDDNEIYEQFFKRRVAVDVYDENRERLKTLNDRYDEEVTFYTNTTYIFKIFVDHEGGIEYPDSVISFEYDEEYISLTKCSEEEDTHNAYYFIGLKEVDETELVIHHERVEDPKTLLITLVDSLEIDNE